MCHAAARHAKRGGLAEGAGALADGHMRVACPACGTEYEAPDEAAGRPLRCAACGHVFRAGGAETARAAPSESPAQQPRADDGAPVEQEIGAAVPDRSESLGAAPASVAALSAAPRIAWGASIAVLVLAGIALHAFRAEIAEAWPPMLRLYRALGLL